MKAANNKYCKGTASWGDSGDAHNRVDGREP